MEFEFTIYILGSFSYATFIFIGWMISNLSLLLCSISGNSKNFKIFKDLIFVTVTTGGTCGEKLSCGEICPHDRDDDGGGGRVDMRGPLIPVELSLIHI